MDLLKHGNFSFGRILKNGYKIQEDVPDVIVEKTMANGGIRKNYRGMPKTRITIKFDDLDEYTYAEYMAHFENNEDVYSYFSPRKQTMLTKKFAVSLPENVMSYGNDDGQIYDEFEVTLQQIDEVEEEP